MSDDSITWDTKRDMKMAQELEKNIKDTLLNKVIGVIEKYMKTSEKIRPSTLIHEIKLVIKNDE